MNDAFSSLVRTPSPIGRLELRGDGEAVVALVIERNGTLPHDQMPEAPDPVLDAAVAQLGEYFAGDRTVFDVPIRATGTEFQRAVWNILHHIGFGEITSYGAIGLEIGKPTAHRAVGGAIGANPVPILVGCHRVLSADGRITGYSGGEGIPTKQWLLHHEGITLAA